MIESVTPSDASPTDGETVFLDVIIANRGLSPVDGVRTRAFLVEPDGTRQPAKSQIFQEATSARLDPGTTQSFRLRWDPFQNAGDSTLLVSANSAYTAPDFNPADNEKTITIRARTKAQLRNVGVGVLKLTADDIAKRQVRFSAKVQNYGETAAHGLKVSFYSEKNMAPETFLGEVEIPVLEPGKTEQAVLTYNLKPGEEDKPINITSEVMYKGSRQRIPLKE